MDQNTEIEATWHTIKATITLDVEMDVQAGTPDEALAKFRDRVCVDAYLIDTPKEQFETIDDGISDIEAAILSK